MPVINLNPGRSHHRSPLVEDIRIDSLRGQLLSLIKSTEAFIKNDSFLRTRLKDIYQLDGVVLHGLITDWLSFRDDCRSVPFCRFRLLYRLRLHSWGETADEQIAKLYGLCHCAASQVLLAQTMLMGRLHSKVARNANTG